MAGKGIQASIADSLPALDGVRQVHGSHDGAGLRIAIVCARFNETLTNALVEQAVAAVRSCGVSPADISVHWVPGAFELPTAMRWVLESEKPDACIAGGAVLEGATTHAQMIARGVTRLTLDLSQEFSVPVIDAVVAVDSLALAEERCLSGKNSRGWYAGLAAVEMATLHKAVRPL